jgi:alpha-1,6-mannosyltransferase
MPYDPSYHLLWRVDKIVTEVRRLRPDVLEIHSPYVAAIGAMAAPRSSFGVRTMQWHSDFIDTYSGTLADKHAPASVLAAAGLAKIPLWAWVRAIGRACDAVLVASKWQQLKLSRQGVPRVVLHPFGIDKNVFKPQARDEARRAMLLPPPFDTLVVGVGRFAIEKRWDVVLEAFVRFASRCEEARRRDLGERARRPRLVLFGDGPERERMQAIVSGREDVMLAGFERSREALAADVASADLLVHGCPYETFGLGVAEALACGVPAVVPDEGGAAELVTDDCGARYRTGDADGMARAMETVLGRDRASLEAAAVEAARALPTVRQEFELQLDLYRELLGKRDRA